MAYLNIETSAGTFSEIRKNGKYYVDKTGFLKELLEPGLAGKKLFTRPRRFGKSVMLSMVGDFLDVRQDSHALFEGLKIMEEEELVRKYMNRFPVVLLSFKDIQGRTISQIKKRMLSCLADVTISSYAEVMESPYVDSAYKADFQAIHDSLYDPDLLAEGLRKICGCLFQYYHSPVVVLIDEYDVPLSKAYGTGCYEDVKDLIESMLSTVCKENEKVQTVILTGCLYSIKGSTHTGVNNIDAFTVTMPPFCRYFGFTEKEVEKILLDADLIEYLPLVREWYDGYLFGNTHIYCPWDVLKFVVDMQRGVYQNRRLIKPKNYWVNTSGTMVSFLRGFLDKAPDALKQFDLLLSGKSIAQTINESLPYHELQASGQNFWTALLEDGYLTLAENQYDEYDWLRIPNREIAEVLKQEIGNYFSRFATAVDLTDFWISLWDGEAEKAEQILSDKLELPFKNLSAGEEYPYQYFLLGAAIDKGYQAEAETDSGYGRLDLKIEQLSENRGLILETKHVKAEGEIDKYLKEAGRQILDNKYYRNLQARKAGEIRCYAVVFYKKECRIEEIPLSL